MAEFAKPKNYWARMTAGDIFSWLYILLMAVICYVYAQGQMPQLKLIKLGIAFGLALEGIMFIWPLWKLKAKNRDFFVQKRCRRLIGLIGVLTAAFCIALFWWPNTAAYIIFASNIIILLF